MVGSPGNLRITRAFLCKHFYKFGFYLLKPLYLNSCMSFMARL